MSTRAIVRTVVGGWAGLGLVLGLAVAGCAPGKGSVSGKVTFNDAPLPKGTITFTQQGGDRNPYSALISDGSYSLDGVPAGEMIVTVVTVDPAKVGGGGGPAPGGEDRPPVGGKPSPGFVPIPARYGKLEESGLKVTIRPGSQTYDVPLQP
jgi:hypothetical protein